MSPSLIFLSLFALSALKVVFASPCIAFDADFNLYAFGLNGKDYNAGTQDTWITSGRATDITASGRPPFDGSTTCYLSQFANAIYVLGGDKSKPSAVHIYDATAKAWSTQAVNTAAFDPKTFTAILDRDTNVFYAISHSELFRLDMGTLKAATKSPLSWEDVQKPPFPDNYQPVMALAQNHIHFINVPDVPAGSAKIFVIHFSFFQPASQSYPNPNGNSFPATHGQTASIFQAKEVQQEFAFIPDDGSSTYIVNVAKNTTRALPGPPVKDAKSQYAAGITSLVQMSSTGKFSFIASQPGGSPSAWSAVQNLAGLMPPQGAASNSSSSSSDGGSTDDPGSPGNTVAAQKSGGVSKNERGIVGSMVISIGLATCLGMI